MIAEMSDDELRRVVTAIDRVSRPLDQRFEGDDEPIVQLMIKMGLTQNIVDKLLINGLVMRECLHRGIQIPHGN
ncbi:MAG: hypothetical protein DI537_10555 [Stutzerimonas stutzeri]|nr:MAG: hypothetical protein DI537_10555 [Stutzerimonas stutzeri]